MISCESQSINLPQEKDETSASFQQNIINQSSPSQKITLESIEKIIDLGTDSDFQAIVSQLPIAINNYPQVYLRKTLHYRLMKYFYRTFKVMNESNQDCQYQLIFIMSLMAEITRRSKTIKLPFTRKIVLAMLSFDESSLNHISYGCQIIKILAVLLQNLTQQGRTAVKLGVEQQVKNGLLRLMGKVDDLFTLQILLKSVKCLITEAKLTITKEQLQKNGVCAGLISHFGQIIACKLKIYLLHLAYRRQKLAQNKTLKDLIDFS